jgi:hypothetical protein
MGRTATGCMDTRDRAEPVHVLIRDHDRKFTRSFDEVLQWPGICMVRTPDPGPAGEQDCGTLRADRSGSLLAPHAPRAK